MFKADFGMVLVFLLASYIFNNQYIEFLICDTLIGIILLINIYAMRAAVSLNNI